MTVHKSISSRFLLREQSERKEAKSNEEKPLNQLQCVSSAAGEREISTYIASTFLEATRKCPKLDLRSIMLRNYVLDDRIIDLARQRERRKRRRKKSQEKLQTAEKKFRNLQFSSEERRAIVYTSNIYSLLTSRFSLNPKKLYFQINKLR